MELFYICYKKDTNQSKYILLLNLGKKDNKICGLVSEEVTETESKLILSNINILDRLPVDEKFKWIKNNCPISYKNGYREIRESNITTITKHVLKQP